ncbi:flagellar export chaperone FlgN [uncultured Clostridium sp.]|uniref:flagellar export chaperone FlgN n=1 Tax=uncultured Clostridium sp. TaxID=59620 RepID=UPI0025ED7642|nr:flagellar export chaperone FlgN [uncultured Clostridium sp.]
MITKLIELMKEQEIHLGQLLVLLQVQKEMIMKKDAFGLEGLVDKLNDCSKKIAQEEVARRKMLNNGSIKEVVSNAQNEELTKVYNGLSETLQKVIFQKETNDLLIKQQISLNSKVLEMMNPNREIKTYNSYGNLSK